MRVLFFYTKDRSLQKIDHFETEQKGIGVMQKVDVVIPVYRPDHRFLQLMELLSRQTEQINHIILMNTEKECFDLFTEGTDFYSKYQNVIVRHVSKKEFDHGNTRNMGTQLV